MLALCGITLCACNEQDSDTVRAIYFYGFEYPEEGEEAIAYVTFSKTDTVLEGVEGVWHSELVNDGAFYKTSINVIEYDESAIFCAVKKLIPQEGLIHDGVEYKGLKVVLRYDTIYKSIKSDASPTRAGRYYVHRFDVSEANESGGFTLTMRSARAEVWYGMLAGIAVGVAAIAIGVHFLIKGGKWQRKKQDE